MSRQKDRGTAFETLCVRWLRQRLGDGRIDRRAMHGSADLGDIYGLYAHGSVGVAEVKDYRSWGTNELTRWKEETLAERDNADADWGLLIPKRYGFGMKTLGRLPVYMTCGDMLRLSNHSYVVNSFSEHARDTWLSMTLEDVCRLVEGPES